MRLYAAVLLIAAMPSYFRGQVYAGSSPAPWLSFTQGNPGVPGDGIKIQGTGGVFYDLTTPIPLLAMANGFLATAFPPRSASMPVAFQLNISNSNPESACAGDGIGVSYGLQQASFKVNGVQGYSLNQPTAGDVTYFVTLMNQIYPGCQMTLGDLSLEGFALSSTPTLDAMALEAMGLSLSFPVKADITGSGVCGGAPCTPSTAPINAVFDHQMHYAYECSASFVGYGKIMPFTNQLIDGPASTTGYGQCKQLYGYEYTGTGTLLAGYNYDSGQNGLYLYYDSHPGYDYNFSFGTAIYPAVNGCVTYLQTAAGVGRAETGHILAIIPEATEPAGGCQTLTNTTGYSVVYMHLSSFYQNQQSLPYYGSVIRCRKSDGSVCQLCNTCAQQNDYVTTDRTQPIGYTGNYFKVWGGVNPHLHFEVDQLSAMAPTATAPTPVDPYGWCGNQVADPYTTVTGMLNEPLWADFTLICP